MGRQEDKDLPAERISNAPENAQGHVPIVAIGASAGGLVPIEQFFDNMRPDSGCAFVVIQHLSPDFRSVMDELLSRHSTMPIHRVVDGMSLEPNAIYLNTPRSSMSKKMAWRIIPSTYFLTPCR